MHTNTRGPSPPPQGCVGTFSGKKALFGRKQTYTHSGIECFTGSRLGKGRTGWKKSSIVPVSTVGFFSPHFEAIWPARAEVRGYKVTMGEKYLTMLTGWCDWRAAPLPSAVLQSLTARNCCGCHVSQASTESAAEGLDTLSFLSSIFRFDIQCFRLKSQQTGTADVQTDASWRRCSTASEISTLHSTHCYRTQPSETNRGTIVINIIQCPVPVLKTIVLQSERGDAFWWPGNTYTYNLVSNEVLMLKRLRWNRRGDGETHSKTDRRRNWKQPLIFCRFIMYADNKAPQSTHCLHFKNTSHRGCGEFKIQGRLLFSTRTAPRHKHNRLWSFTASAVPQKYQHCFC